MLTVSAPGPGGPTITITFNASALSLSYWISLWLSHLTLHIKETLSGLETMGQSACTASIGSV
jgi:hypothetical protein